MGISSGNSPYGDFSVMVNHMIGDAYYVVKTVYDNIEYIKITGAALSLNGQTLTAEERARVRQNIDVYSTSETNTRITNDIATLSGTVNGALALKQASDADLSALAEITQQGFLSRTGTGTAAARSIVGTVNEITITSGDGVSNNPVVSLPSRLTFSGKEIIGGLYKSVSLDTNSVVVLQTLGNNTLKPASTSFVQAEFMSRLGNPNGIATLNSSGLIPISQLPAIAITDTYLAVSQLAMLSLAAQKGDIAVRTDINKTFVLSTDSPTTLADWIELKSPTDVVTSVAGKTGVVLLDKNDVGLENVNNTTDMAKPISNLMLTALNEKASLENPTFTGNVTGISKSMVGLSNADNTSDAQKVSSGVIKDALDLKADLISGKIPSNQLPAYVDDVLEYANQASFPVTGETSKIYIDLATNKTYRWSGSVYVSIGNDLVLGETQLSAYRGDRGKIGYEHSTVTGNPHGTTKADIGLGNADNTSDAQKVASGPINLALANKSSKGLSSKKLSSQNSASDSVFFKEQKRIAILSQSAALSLSSSSSAYVAVTFNEILVDNITAFKPTVSAAWLTVPPRAKKVSLFVSAEWDNVTTGARNIRFTQYSSLFVIKLAKTFKTGIEFSKEYTFNVVAGDFFLIEANQESGGVLNLNNIQAKLEVLYETPYRHDGIKITGIQGTWDDVLTKEFNNDFEAMAQAMAKMDHGFFSHVVTFGHNTENPFPNSSISTYKPLDVKWPRIEEFINRVKEIKPEFKVWVYNSSVFDWLNWDNFGNPVGVVKSDNRVTEINFNTTVNAEHILKLYAASPIAHLIHGIFWDHFNYTFIPPLYRNNIALLCKQYGYPIMGNITFMCAESVDFFAECPYIDSQDIGLCEGVIFDNGEYVGGSYDVNGVYTPGTFTQASDAFNLYAAAVSKHKTRNLRFGHIVEMPNDATVNGHFMFNPQGIYAESAFETFINPQFANGNFEGDLIGMTRLGAYDRIGALTTFFTHYLKG